MLSSSDEILVSVTASSDQRRGARRGRGRLRVTAAQRLFCVGATQRSRKDQAVFSPCGYKH